MIRTFYGLGTLDSGGALFAALVIGFFFGLALERAGFGSSRRLSGIFYFRDMAVLKVMFTALLTAMIGLNICTGMGIISPAIDIYFMPTYYGAYIIAGLIFGVGFAMGGWCPGTAAVGMASGKLDALFFLGGGVIGSVFYNEVYPLIKPLATWGQSVQENFGQPGLAFVYTSLGISGGAFALIFTLAAVVCFWGSEYLERARSGDGTGGDYWGTPFLKAFSLCFLVFAANLFLFSPMPHGSGIPATESGAVALLEDVAEARDHVEPEALAQAIYSSEPGLVVVDVRPEPEYAAFHIRGAVNVLLPDIPAFMARQGNAGRVVLYSNGMTHPVQGRDELYRMGYRNVFILTDGLTGFMERCLKPVSLRATPLSAADAAQVNAWRAYFYAGDIPAKIQPAAEILSGLVSTEQLAAILKNENVKVVDCRSQPEYNRGHIPGAMALNGENLRGVADGVPSVLMPAEILAAQFSLAGIGPSDTVVLVYSGDKVRDATIVGMAFERLGHRSWAILDGGFDKWIAEARATDTLLPPARRERYPSPGAADRFTADYRQVMEQVGKGNTVIIDTRPADYYTGAKSDEARAGHIPGAINRPFAEDLNGTALKPVSELEAAYEKLIPSKGTPVIVHCRTGHQASQTFFVLTHLLGYKNVRWYDAGWTEWAARPELPVVTGASAS